MTHDSFSDLERAVVAMLLAGDGHTLKVLRDQFAVSRILKRDVTGVGFFTYFDVPADVPRVPAADSAQIDDVAATIEGLQHGAGFVLFLRNGALYMLEGYTFDEPWPSDLGAFSLRYSKLPGDLRLHNP
jgi:hypothetical protein